MRKGVNDLLAFLVVARERSFTRAAAQLGLSPSALSHTIRGLEERLGLRVLTPTTRNVSPTDAGPSVRICRPAGKTFIIADSQSSVPSTSSRIPLLLAIGVAPYTRFWLANLVIHAKEIYSLLAAKLLRWPGA